jgi:hypothetical protein
MFQACPIRFVNLDRTTLCLHVNAVQASRSKMPDSDSKQIAERAKALFGHIEGRSPLLDWMRENHALVTHQLTISRPRWEAIAGVIAAQGVRDANGKPPRGETVRRAWQRVTASGSSGGKQVRSSRSAPALAAPSSTTSLASHKALPPIPPATVETVSVHPPPAAATLFPNQHGSSGPANVPAPLPPPPAFDPSEGAFDPKPPPAFRNVRVRKNFQE